VKRYGLVETDVSEEIAAFMFRVQESPYVSYCLLWAAALVLLCASGRGLVSTGCLFNLTTVVFRFLPILLHAEWAVILHQVTADTTMTYTFPVLLSNLCQMAPLVSVSFTVSDQNFMQLSLFLDACYMSCLSHVQV
jgi:uncharacterized membrane protein YqaE (UPF0057 family)